MSSLVLTVEAYDVGSLAVDETLMEPNKLKVYPNPSTGQVQVKGAEMGSLISIYLITGVRVFTSKYDGLPINFDQLDSGLYFVKVDNKTLKLIIKD